MGFNIKKTLGKVAGTVLDYANPINAVYSLSGGGRRGRDLILPELEGTAALIPGNPAAVPLGMDAARRLYGAVSNPSGANAGSTTAPTPTGTGNAWTKATDQYKQKWATPPGQSPLPSWVGNQGSDIAVSDWRDGLSGNAGPVSYQPGAYQSKSYSGPTAQEQQNSSNVSDIARLLGGEGAGLYGISSPLYKQAADYYAKILSGDKGAASQAIAPEAENIAELNTGRMKGIESSGLRGGAREMALADTGRQAAGEIAKLIPEARQNAASAGGQLSLSGMSLGTQQQGAAAGLYGDLLAKGQQDRQFGQQLEQQDRQFGADYAQKDRQFQADLSLRDKLGTGDLNLRQASLQIDAKLRSRGLDLNAITTMNDLALKRELGMLGINLDQQKVAMMQQQLKNLTSTQAGEAAGNMGSMVLTTLIDLLGSKSKSTGPSYAGIPTTGGNTGFTGTSSGQWI